MFEKAWHDLTREQQDLYVTLLWKDGYSEKAIADFFGTTKGRIVVHRQRVLKLPSNDDRRRPPSFVTHSVNPERFSDLLELHARDELLKRGVIPLTSGTDKFATPGALSKEESAPLFVAEEIIEVKCEWPSARNVPCGKDVVPGHKLCAEHLKLVPKGKLQWW